MALAIETNTNINTKEKLIENTIKSLVSSFKLEGIIIPIEKARIIVEQEYERIYK